MSKVAIGFFTPAMLVSDVGAFCERVRQVVPPVSRAFPVAIEQTTGESGRSHLSYMAVSGSVPIHIEKPNANESTSSMFHFVMEAENRPFMVSAPATAEHSEALLNPESRRNLGMGALELRTGRAVHFDVARVWQGILGAPTGDQAPSEPTAIILRVPIEDATRIQTAIARAQQALRTDERFKDLAR